MFSVVSLRDTFLEKELRKLGHVVDVPIGGVRTTTADLVHSISNSKPDVFWIYKDPQITPQMLLEVKNASPSTKIIMWWGDQRGDAVPPLIDERKNLLDALFMTNEDPSQYKLFRGLGIQNIHTFYHSFSLDEFATWDVPVKYQVFFGGSNFKKHKFPLSRFRNKFICAVNDKFKLVVHGNGWPFKTEPWVLREEYAKKLRVAHMNIGINHYNIFRYYNRRLFECVASGRMHLTYYIPGMEKHFSNRNHLVWFKTVEEGISLVNFYMKHPKDRERIAKQGRDLVIREHSWPVRTKQFVELVEGMLQ